jgi:hypothetical protein
VPWRPSRSVDLLYTGSCSHEYCLSSTAMRTLLGGALHRSAERGIADKYPQSSQQHNSLRACNTSPGARQPGKSRHEFCWLGLEWLDPLYARELEINMYMTWRQRASMHA